MESDAARGEAAKAAVKRALTLLRVPRLFARPRDAERCVYIVLRALPFLTALPPASVRALARGAADAALACSAAGVTRAAALLCLALGRASASSCAEVRGYVAERLCGDGGAEGTAAAGTAAGAAARAALCGAALLCHPSAAPPPALLRALCAALEGLEGAGSARRSGRRALRSTQRLLATLAHTAAYPTAATPPAPEPAQAARALLRALCAPELDDVSAPALLHLARAGLCAGADEAAAALRALLRDAATRQLLPPASAALPARAAAEQLCALLGEVRAAERAAGHAAPPSPAQCEAALTPLGKLLRTRTEAALALAAPFVWTLGAACLGAGSGACASPSDEWLAPLLAGAAHGTREDSRSAATALALALGRAAAASALPLPPLPALIVDALGARKAAYPLWQARAGLLGALAAFAAGARSAQPLLQPPSPPTAPWGAAAVAVTTFLATGVLASEPHDTVRRAGLVALSHWLPLLPLCSATGLLDVPEALVRALVAGLGKGEAGFATAIYYAAAGVTRWEDGARDGAQVGGSGFWAAAPRARARSSADAGAPATPGSAAVIQYLASSFSSSSSGSGSSGSGERRLPQLLTAALFSAVAEHFAPLLAPPPTAAAPKFTPPTLPSSPSGIPLAALAALGTLTLVAAHSRECADMLSTPVLYGRGAGAGGAGGAAAGAAAAKPAAKSAAVGKGAATAAAGGGAGAPSASAFTSTPHPIFGAAVDASAAAAAAGGKVFSLWDAFTAPALVPLLFGCPALLGNQGRSAGDVSSATAASLVAVRTLTLGLRAWEGAMVKPCPKLYMAAVLGELEGSSSSSSSYRGELDGVVGEAIASEECELGFSSAAIAVASTSAATPAPPPRQPNAFWTALLVYLSHSSHIVRAEAARGLQAAYAALPTAAGTLAAAALHALWDRLRSLEVCAPRLGGVNTGSSTAIGTAATGVGSSAWAYAAVGGVGGGVGGGQLGGSSSTSQCARGCAGCGKGCPERCGGREAQGVGGMEKRCAASGGGRGGGRGGGASKGPH